MISVAHEGVFKLNYYESKVWKQVLSSTRYRKDEGGKACSGLDDIANPGRPLTQPALIFLQPRRELVLLGGAAANKQPIEGRNSVHDVGLKPCFPILSPHMILDYNSPEI